MSRGKIEVIISPPVNLLIFIISHLSLPSRRSRSRALGFGSDIRASFQAFDSQHLLSFCFQNTYSTILLIFSSEQGLYSFVLCTTNGLQGKSQVQTKYVFLLFKPKYDFDDNG